jgi:hypothetical protein
MKISKAGEILLKIHEQFGDLEISGGALTDETPLRHVTVIDTEGRELWPCDPLPVSGQRQINGVFLD